LSGEQNPLKDTKEMLGEFLREVASLIVVFLPLEVALKKHSSWQQLVYWTLSAFGVSGLLLWYGVYLEKRRSDDGANSFRNAWLLWFNRLRYRFKKQAKKED
jgi:hypothetical protein